MYARGIRCLPVDLYKSHATRFIITDEGILPPLTQRCRDWARGGGQYRGFPEDGEFVSIEDRK